LLWDQRDRRDDNGRRASVAVPTAQEVARLGGGVAN
jgi:hypothetical protein